MKLLLDTHFLEWLARAPDEITKQEAAVILDEGNALLISAVSIWEIRLKWEKFDRTGRRKGLLDPALAMHYIAENNLELAALTGEDCAARLESPPPHGDPFDYMLLIHAARLGAWLLTRDRLLIDHPIALQL